jgi:hypothetical protein
LVTTGIVYAIAAASEAAGDKDVGLMGGGVVTEALRAGLVDELILHLVPICSAAAVRSSRNYPSTWNCASSKSSWRRASPTCTTRSSDDPHHGRLDFIGSHTARDSNEGGVEDNGDVDEAQPCPPTRMH